MGMRSLGTRSLKLRSIGVEKLSWILLALPCFLLVWAAFGEDRAGWRQLRFGEATALMQAESLIEDGDLTYERLDFERHVVTRYGPPGDLALASGTGGRILTYDSSFVPALLYAAGLMLFGEFGFAAVNAILLLAALAFAVVFPRGRLPQSSAAGLGLLIFGSAGFAFVFQAAPHALIFAATLTAAALVLRHEDPHPRSWLIAGLLLSLALFSRWQHVLLLLPFLAALPPAADVASKRAARIALGIGVLIGLAGQSLVLWWAGGGLGAIDTVRFVFTPASGFPLIDLPSENWEHTVERLAALHFIGAPRFSWGLEPTLLAKNALYFFCGQNIGLLAYASAPLLLLVLGVRRLVFRFWLLAFAATAILALLLDPFDLVGGGSPGNPHLLPLLAATILLWQPAKRFEGAGMLGVTALAFLLAAPFLFNLWLAPGAAPSVETEHRRVENGRGALPSHATRWARSLLPYELSQQTLPGGPVYGHAGLRVRLLSSSLAEKSLDVFTLEGRENANLWVASPAELSAIHLAFDESAPASIELLDDRALLLDRELRSDGGVTFRIAAPAERHIMWWSPRVQWVYRVDFRLPTAGEERLEWSLAGESAEAGGIR